MGDLIRLWGKTGVEGTSHPLACHMIDAGMVSRALLRAPQYARIKRLIARLSGIDSAVIEHAVPFVVALHDIGKAAPGFQRLVPDLWASVERDGFRDVHPMWAGVRFRHDIESYVVLANATLQKLIVVEPGDVFPRVARRAISGLVGWVCVLRPILRCRWASGRFARGVL